MMQINLKNKNVLITGASRGIGQSIAEVLVDCGAHVALHYCKNKNRAEKVRQSLSPKATLYQCDFDDRLEISGFFNQVLNDFGKLDVIINNAGIAIHSDPEKDDISWVDDWLYTMDINLNAVGFLCKKAIQHFKGNGEGIIINMSSRAAFRGDSEDYLAYAASKAGLVALTRSIARAYGKAGIKAFLVAPGFVRTDMAQSFIHEYGEDFAMQDNALDQMTEPKDVAQFVAFLASGLANHATGGTFDINAGSYVH